jgi:hypothetical protein
MSEIKVNKISPRTACGTVTLGDSGDTFTIPSGATITNSGTAAGFGATGAVSWDTTAKTTGFTAVDGVGYFVNTTAGAITVTLPLSPAAGAVIGVSDYANIFATNNLTLGRNGSNIGGVTADSALVVNGAAVTLVYVDATKGWIVTDSGLQSDASELKTYVTASVSGACNTLATAPDCGNFKIATFTGPGNFTVCSAGNAAGSNSVDYLIVAGGAGGGQDRGGAGGAGGYRETYTPAVSGTYTASPLALATSTTVTAQTYPIVIGAGGAGRSSGTSPGGDGNVSSGLGITSAGGGGGAGSSPTSGTAGGSGGGGAGGPTSLGGAGNTPPVSPPQGNAGGAGYSGGSVDSGPGGGAGGAGGNAEPPAASKAGGIGVSTEITGASVGYAGGGGGGGSGNPGPASPTFGGGSGGGSPATPPGVTGNGVANRGGGGGGSRGTSPVGANGGNGGSGVVIIRFRFQ